MIQIEDQYFARTAMERIANIHPRELSEAFRKRLIDLEFKKTGEVLTGFEFTSLLGFETVVFSYIYPDKDNWHGKVEAVIKVMDCEQDVDIKFVTCYHTVEKNKEDAKYRATRKLMY